MHPSAQRLYEAAQRLKPPVRGKSAVARLLNESPQTVHNWETRGVSKAGAMAAQTLTGYSATWILDGVGPPVLGSAQPETPASTSTMFDALTADEKRLLDNFRAMLDDDQKRLAEEVAEKAAKMRAYTAKVLERVGASAQPAKHSADARKTNMARAALDITDELRQRSLLDPADKGK